MFKIARHGITTRLLQRATRIAATFASRRMLVFTYDELMSSAYLDALGIVAARSVAGFVENRQVLAAAPTDRKGIGALSLAPVVGKKTYGVIHDIAAIELVQLDILAARCSFVRKLVQVVDEHGYENDGWIFVAKAHKAGLRWEAAHKAQIVEIADAADLPKYYVDYLRALPSIDAETTDAAPCMDEQPILALSSGH